MNLSLVLHRKQWEASDFSDITKEELDLAEKHPQWFIKKWFNEAFWPVDYYITKNLNL